MNTTRASILLALTSLGAMTAACDGNPSDGEDAGVTLMLDADVDAYVPPGDDGGPISEDASPGSDASIGTDAGAVGPTSELVDPMCTDGMFSEPLPDWNADISDLVDAYTEAEAEAFLLGMLDRRYPTGALLVRGGGDCLTHFLRDTSSPGAVLGWLDIIVHECGHFYNLGMGSIFQLNETLRLTPAGGATFARNLIVEDEFQADRARCEGGNVFGCDRYANTYLADDASGSQGFHMLFEEAVQYVHSVAAGLTITNELGASSRNMSHRDGLLTFLWYIERYLRMARLEYPDVYALLVEGGDDSWREAILTLWGQAWLYLEVTSDMPHLGVEDHAIEPLVLEPVLLEEIQRLRDASGC